MEAFSHNYSAGDLDAPLEVCGRVAGFMPAWFGLGRVACPTDPSFRLKA
jgi:hypothetical protein